jgi:hypothetical protein
MPSVFERKLSCQPRFDSAHELHDPHREDHLADPKDKHPFDDFCLHFRSVMLRHQSARKVLFLLSEGNFEAFGNRPSLIGFDLCALKNVQNFSRTHKAILSRLWNSSMTPANYLT